MTNQAVLRTRDGAHGLTDQLAALDAWLDRHPIRGEIEWIVGIDHIRYLLLPWDPRSAIDAFSRSLAAACFLQSFGSEIPFDAYQLRFAPLAFGRPRLAALIANDAIRELAAFSRRRKCRTRLIAPALSIVWNRFLARLRKDAGALVLVDGPRLLQLDYDRGHMTAFSIQPFSGARPSPMPAGSTWIFPAHDPAAPASGASTLDAYAPDDDAHLAYVLCGVA
ncbi:hypothetical protein [Burkholderia sp. BCC1977]|uniref:hypothetical protein n=1 Tax=Burkholderia sp. BCC1977 TaxID=2817440 RepID=UPI002ABE6095|nr:hypothetical protein [Burkholderia sp. BCC1977]